MARHSIPEILTGAAVLVVAVGFLAYAGANTGQGSVDGYQVTASFSSIDGLSVGSDVRLAGVKVGRVITTRIDPKTYQANVDMTVQEGLQLPTDSSAQITSDGLLGGKFISLVPGGADVMIKPGGAVTITQSAVSLEDLLGKFIFNVGALSTAVQHQLDSNKPESNGSKPAAPLGELH
jgi:phospholipid/cholesterol/gamma-HCH transport system substrate-binding protein